MKYQSRSKVSGLVTIYTAVAFLVIAIVFPIGWLVRMAIIPAALVTELPPRLLFQPTLESFRQVVKYHPILRYVANSLLTAVLATALALAIGLPAAYALTRFRFWGKSFLSLGVLCVYVMPPIAMVLPLYVIFSSVGLGGRLLALVFAHTLITFPLVIWLLRGFLVKIPVELEEAAMIDGCGRLEALIRVVIPILAPGLSATTILAFLYSWNDFLYASILTSRGTGTLPIMISGFITDKAVYWDRIAASGSLVLLPPLIMGMLIQRYLVEGLSAGAVKG